MENIQVAVRVRPMNRQEILANDENIWTITSGNTVALNPQALKDLTNQKKLAANLKPQFSFDQVFDYEDENTKVYEKAARRIALSSLNGINGTVFMYGQTGAGKTFTMLGTEYRADVLASSGGYPELFQSTDSQSGGAPSNSNQPASGSMIHGPGAIHNGFGAEKSGSRDSLGRVARMGNYRRDKSATRGRSVDIAIPGECILKKA
jgi:hypothetical protein